MHTSSKLTTWIIKMFVLLPLIFSLLVASNSFKHGSEYRKLGLVIKLNSKDIRSSPKCSKNDDEYINTKLFTLSPNLKKIMSGVAQLLFCSVFIDIFPPGAQSASAPPVVTVAKLEEVINTLEKANSRSDTIQGLADVFEAAGSKTLLVRTKYKYVSSCVISYDATT